MEYLIGTNFCVFSHRYPKIRENKYQNKYHNYAQAGGARKLIAHF